MPIVIEIFRLRIFIVGIALGDDDHRFVVGLRRFDRFYRAIAAHEQRRDHVRKQHRIAHGQQRRFDDVTHASGAAAPGETNRRVPAFQNP